MNFISLRSLFLAPLSSMVIASLSPVHAQDVQSPSASRDRALQVAMARIGKELSHEQLAVLNLAAHAAAAAGLCVDLELNESAVYGALAAVTHDATEGQSGEDLQRHRDFALIAYGVMVGLMLEDGAKNEAAFCAQAVQDVKDPEAGTFLRVVSKAVPYLSEN
jgi:hypothetical protein